MKNKEEILKAINLLAGKLNEAMIFVTFEIGDPANKSLYDDSREVEKIIGKALGKLEDMSKKVKKSEE